MWHIAVHYPNIYSLACTSLPWKSALSVQIRAPAFESNPRALHQRPFLTMPTTTPALPSRQRQESSKSAKNMPAASSDNLPISHAQFITLEDGTQVRGRKAGASGSWLCMANVAAANASAT
jgi:hypothetical protein